MGETMSLEYQHLIGKRFNLSKQDCFKLVQDFFFDNYGIEIKNYARPSDWDSNELDIIGYAHEREGFFKVQDWTLTNLRPGDVLCMAVGTSIPNHYAVYVGDGKFVHHLVNSLSSEEELRPFWRRSTCYVLRHKDVEFVPVPKPEKTLLEILHERNLVNTPQAV